MRKAVQLLLAGILLAGGAAFAQNSASHTLHVNLPQMLMIRMTDGTKTGALSSEPDVNFDYSSNTNAYLAAIQASTAGGHLLGQTSTSGGAPALGDIIVLSNVNGWTVGVSTGSVGGTASTPFSMDRVRVYPTGYWTALTKTFGTFFTLGSGGDIFSGDKTTGWKSLGISGDDYKIYVDGTEDPGTTTAIVTYQFTAP